jgi:deoxyribonuclease-4
MIRFGPAGNSDSFYEQKNKSSTQMPKWLYNMGLSAYEYQCSKGVNISKDKAIELGKEAKKYDVFLSIHAPYYISLSSKEEDKRINSVKYIIDTLQAARWMGAQRVVIHPGGISGMERKEALDIAAKTLKMAIDEADNLGLGDISICPETMGKIGQLGSIDEIIELCKMDGRLIPTIDFGHVHARGLGAINSAKDFEAVLDQFENGLGKERMCRFHSHFSRIEFTNSGEKKHWTFDDVQFGPEFDMLAGVLAKRKLSPVMICESRGTMAEDALKMKKMYEHKTKLIVDG